MLTFIHQISLTVMPVGALVPYFDISCRACIS